MARRRFVTPLDQALHPMPGWAPQEPASESSRLARAPLPKDLDAFLLAEQRKRQSDVGRQDLALVEALGHRVRYLTADQGRMFYPRLSAPAIGKRLRHLYDAHWVNRRPLKTGRRSPPDVYWIGRLGKQWLHLLDAKNDARWTDNAALDPNSDQRLAHWLCLADVWAGIAPPHSVDLRIEMVGELHFNFPFDDPTTRRRATLAWKPDGRLSLTGQSDTDFVAYLEIDRGTEALTKFEAYKVVNARRYYDSPAWPHHRATAHCEYWVFFETEKRRQQALERLFPVKTWMDKFKYQARWQPFGPLSRWRLWLLDDWRHGRWDAGKIPASPSQWQQEVQHPGIWDTLWVR